MANTFKAKVRVAEEENSGFQPAVLKEIVYDTNHIRIDDQEISSIDSAELEVTYNFMVPTRLLHIASRGQLISIGPLKASQTEQIPIEYDENIVRDFWTNQFMAGIIAVLILLKVAQDLIT